RADYGLVDGHDGLFARLCGPRIPYPHGPQGARSNLSGPKRQAHPEPDGTLGIPLLRGDSCALHPRTRTHDSQSDRRAPAPAPTPGKAVCVVLSIKMHPNQALCAEWRLYIPAMTRVQESLGRYGLLYVGDCKMAARETRAFLQTRGDFYLCPLPAVQLAPDEV